MGIFHSHLARRNTLYGHWGVVWDLLYRETLRHSVYAVVPLLHCCAYALVPLLCRRAYAVVPLAHCVAYALLVHHVIQADDPCLRAQTGVEEGALPLVHQKPQWVVRPLWLVVHLRLWQWVQWEHMTSVVCQVVKGLLWWSQVEVCADVDHRGVTHQTGLVQ